MSLQEQANNSFWALLNRLNKTGSWLHTSEGESSKPMGWRRCEGGIRTGWGVREDPA